jgi:hypothetical protein
MTFGELQDAVKVNIIDLPTPVLNAVPTLVKRAHHKLMEKHNFFVMKAEKQVFTADDTRVLTAVPTDWKRPRSRPYIVPENGTAKFIHWGTQEVLGRYAPSDTGTPTFLLDDGTDISVYPLPDQLADTTSTNYDIRIPYFKWLTALSATGDSDWLTIHAEAYIEYAATAQGFAMDWDEDHAKYWLGLAQQELTDVINADKERWLGALDTFAPNMGAYGPRTQL